MRLADLNGNRPMVWAFIPYSVEGGRLSAETYDTEQTKSELAAAFHTLGLAWVWQPVVLDNVGALVAHVRESQRRRPTVVFNFCDGVENQGGMPGLSVVRTLEREGIPFTGAGSEFYEISTSKVWMKRLFQEHGVATAPFEVLPAAGPVEGVCARLGGGPLIVKPDVSSASCGITLKSKVWNDEQVRSRRDEIAPAFHSTELFVEKFLGGEEFTVFVGGYWDVPDRIWTLPPARRAFAEACPAEERFLSYERYWGLYQDEAPVAGDEPFYHYERVDAGLGEELRSLAAAAFGAVRGHGYARVDIRQDTGSGELCVLEVNANCGLSEDDQTSTGSILALNGWSYAELLGRILEQTIERGAGARAAAVVARA